MPETSCQLPRGELHPRHVCKTPGLLQNALCMRMRKCVALCVSLGLNFRLRLRRKSSHVRGKFAAVAGRRSRHVLVAPVALELWQLRHRVQVVVVGSVHVRRHVIVVQLRGLVRHRVSRGLRVANMAIAAHQCGTQLHSGEPWWPLAAIERP